MSDPIRVLIVEDRAADAELMLHELRQAGFDPEWQRVDNEPDFLAALETKPDLILADWNLPQFSGLRALQLSNERGLDIAFVVVSGSIVEQAAMEAMHQGAVDYLMKDRLARLGVAAHNALEIKQLRELRKREEATLIASEELHRTILETALDGFWLLDMQGLLLEVNAAYCRMSGYSAQELLQRHITDLEFIENVSETAAHIQKVLTQGSDRFETRHRRKDGSIFEVEASVLYRPDKGGQMVVFLRDISVRKQTEEEVRASQQLLKKTLSSLLDAVFILDANTVEIKDCNQAATAIFGYSREEMLGKTTTFLHVDQAALDEFRRYLNPAVEEKGFLFLPDFRMKRKDATIFPTENSVIPIVDDQGKHTGWVSVVRDITERKRAEQKLEEERSLLQTVIDNLPARVYAMDDQGRKILSNKEDWQASGGKTMEDVIGKTDFDSYPPEMAKDFWALDKQVIDSGESILNREEPGLDSQGNRISVLSSKVPLRNSQGKIIGLVGVGQDISERKRADEQLKEYSEHLEEMVAERTRELREAQEQLVRKEKLAVMGQLAGSVGHELRNPLGVINTAIYYLKSVQPDAGEKVKRYHAMIEQEVRNADKIITDLLDFARGIKAERTACAIPERVQHVLERFPAPAGVEVTVDFPADLPMALADPPQVEQVLGNLMINAYQAMATQKSSATGGKEGGKLIFSAHVVVPVPERDLQKEMLAIAVKDTGTGIMPENMMKIFEPLFTTKAKGIGLGLAVSKKLAEANDGRIEVESEVGKGSTFTLFLPVWSQERVNVR